MVGTLSDLHHQRDHLMSDHFIPFNCLSPSAGNIISSYKAEPPAITTIVQWENVTIKEVSEHLQLQFLSFSHFH